MIKRIFIDTETTSVNRYKCGLWQIGGIIEAGKRKEEFLFECDIFKEDLVDQKALERHNLTIEKLSEKPDPEETMKKFQELLGKYVDKYDPADKFYFINFGAEFDAEVIRQWFEKNDDNYYGSWFWHPPIDVMVLAVQDIIGQRHQLKNFKQSSVLEYYKIDHNGDDLHNALYDAKMAREIYYKIMEV